MGIALCALTAATVLIVNVMLTIIASVKYGLHAGFGTLLDGNCRTTRNLNLWLHLAINVLSTLLLGASNYCMQCLASPTREEIGKRMTNTSGLTSASLAYEIYQGSPHSGASFGAFLQHPQYHCICCGTVPFLRHYHHMIILYSWPRLTSSASMVSTGRHLSPEHAPLIRILKTMTILCKDIAICQTGKDWITTRAFKHMRRTMYQLMGT